MSPPLRIGRLAIDPPLVLAPMAGLCDRHFRLLIRRIGGVGLVSMEFISSEEVTRGHRGALKKLRFSDEERPLAIQIYGKDPGRMAECAARVEDLAPEVCDINMGCPANKVLNGCAGANLMADLKHAAAIITACRARLTIPLTVKFRIGTGRGPDPANYLELGRICQDLGVDAITLHGRTAKQMYTGRADWDAIARLKRSVTIPVIGNGDVTTPDEALELFRQTGCDAVMIGRGVLTDPWLFRKTAAALSGRPVPETTLTARREAIVTHYRWIIDEEERGPAMQKLRTFTGRYTHGIPGGRRLRRQIASVPAPEAFLELIEGHFDALARGEMMDGAS
ncbi:MAG: tRNA-dihydrouridine synthase [Acidobacteria bacterium]|nr:tRNA-dihydrouridine synthase [Acidobacteriota bacterium]